MECQSRWKSVYWTFHGTAAENGFGVRVYECFCFQVWFKMCFPLLRVFYLFSDQKRHLCVKFDGLVFCFHSLNSLIYIYVFLAKWQFFLALFFLALGIFLTWNLLFCFLSFDTHFLLSFTLPSVFKMEKKKFSADVPSPGSPALAVAGFAVEHSEQQQHLRLCLHLLLRAVWAWLVLPKLLFLLEQSLSNPRVLWSYTYAWGFSIVYIFYGTFGIFFSFIITDSCFSFCFSEKCLFYSLQKF